MNFQINKINENVPSLDCEQKEVMQIENTVNMIKDGVKIVKKNVRYRNRRKKRMFEGQKGNKRGIVGLKIQENLHEKTREILKGLTTNSSLTVSKKLANIFKEDNWDLLNRIVDDLGVDQALKFAEETIDLYYNGGIYKKDSNDVRTMGGTFFKLVKDYLDLNDPMKMKAIFRKVGGSTQHLKKIKKNQRRKERKRLSKRIGTEALSSTMNMSN